MFILINNGKICFSQGYIKGLSYSTKASLIHIELTACEL